MEFLRNKENWLVLVIVAVVLFFSFGKSRAEQPALHAFSTETNAAETTESDDVVVHITGRVASPGVYALPADARWTDAVEAAGGLLPDADVEAVNLSRKLKDEDRLHIPAIGKAPAFTNPTAQSADDGLIDINHATANELEQLPGIGPALAGRIVDTREQTPFQTTEDIKKVPGIGEKIFESLKDKITVR